MPKRKKPDADPVLAYARDVVEGRILAGRLVRLAAERHIRDLETGPARGLRWDLDAAMHAIGFFGYLQLAEGDFAGKPFELEPFQKFKTGSIFGWKGADGYRRFRTAYLEEGKGNGKTPWAAGVGLYGLVADNEHGSEVYAAATMRDQAKILFTDAERMVAASPHLAQTITANVNNLALLDTNSYFRPVSSEAHGLDGKRVHMALIDEIHEHPTSLVVDKMRAGTKGRRQALIVEITNSGVDRNTVCWHHHEYSVKLLEGSLENDSWFAYICQLDTCDECRKAGKENPTDGCPNCDQWTDEATWLKANPCLDVSITRKYLREQVREAVGMPSKEGIVRRLNFCQWTTTVTRWLPMEKWNACKEAVAALDELRERPCYGGLDLASTNDLTALALVFPPRDADEYDALALVDDPDAEPPELPWDVLVWCWVPEESASVRAARDRVPYLQWNKQTDDLHPDGLIEMTPGDVTDYEFVRKRINDLAAIFDIKEIGFDPYNATQLAIQLGEQDGLTMVEVRQGMVTLNEPTKFMERLVLARGLRHGGNPVLTWCVSNVAIRSDAAGNKKPDKEKSQEKIDPAVATIIALERAIKSTGNAKSVYETRGMLRLG